MKKNQPLSNRGGKRVGAGRKVGIPNKSNQEVKEIIDRNLNPEEQFKLLIDIAISGNIRALEVLLAYRWGKPKESIDMNLTGTLTLTQLLEEIDGRTKKLSNTQG